MRAACWAPRPSVEGMRCTTSGYPLVSRCAFISEFLPRVDGRNGTLAVGCAQVGLDVVRYDDPPWGRGVPTFCRPDVAEIRSVHANTGGTVRALLVANHAPWPSVGGSLIRLAQVVEAAASVAELDLFVLHNPRQPEIVVPPDIHLARWAGAPESRASHPLRWRIEWAARRG